METLIKNKKEVLLEFKKNTFTIPSEEDREYLKEFLTLETLDQILDEIIETPLFKRAVKFHKINLILQSFQLFLFICLTAFIIIRFYIESLIILDIINFDLIIVNSILLFQILATILFLIFKYKFIAPIIKEILVNKLAKEMQIKFFQAQYLINNVNGGFDLLIRIVLYQNNKIQEIDMDYYDYVNFNNPEVEDFYLKKNPFNYDPYVKKIK